MSEPAPAAPPLRRTYLLLYAAGLALALPAFAFLATERFSLTARLLAWLGLGLALLPTLHMLLRPGARRCSVAATGLLLALYYPLGVFHERRLLLRWGLARVGDGAVELALLLAALATPLLWLGWGLGGALGIGRVLPRPALPVAPRVLQRAGAALVLLSLGADWLWLHGQLTTYQPAVGIISALLPLELGVAMLIVHQLGEGVRPRDRLIFWAVLALVGLFALGRGMILVIARPVLLYLLGALYLRRRLLLWPVLLGLLAVLLMQPVKGEFRQRVWDQRAYAGVLPSALLYMELVARHWIGDEFSEGKDAGESVSAAAARTGANLALAHVMELTPRAVPHQLGGTYRYLLYAPVPRILYPEKPIAQQADVWAAVVYGYTTEKGTSHVMVGLSQLAEAYINFGLFGAMLTLLLTGALYRAGDELFGREGTGAGAQAVYLYFVSNTMIGIEGSFAQTWGGMAQALLLYGGFMALLGRRAPLSAP